MAKLPNAPQKHTFYIIGAGAEIAVDIWGCKINIPGFPKGTFFEKNGYVAMHAEHASYRRSGSNSRWELLSNYGKLGNAYKVYPAIDTLKPPVLGYYFVVMQQGEYYLEIWSAPANPLSVNGRICFGLAVNNEDFGEIPTVQEDYIAGEPDNQEWSQGCWNKSIRRN